MELSALLKAMASNANCNITITDGEDNVLVTFLAPGYAQIEDTLQKRKVKKVKVQSSEKVVIIVDDAEPEPTIIPVTGVVLNKSSVTLAPDASESLTATVTPADATNKSVVWSSSDSAVASVESGIVTAVAVGNATITVTTSDGGFTATCAITVEE